MSSRIVSQHRLVTVDADASWSRIPRDEWWSAASGGSAACAAGDQAPARREIGYCIRVDELRVGTLMLVAACGSVAAPASRDASVDTQVSQPTLVASEHAHISVAATLSFSLTVPPGDDRYLLVAAGIGSHGGDTTVPSVTGISYGGAPLTRVSFVTGTPAAQNATRSEQWQLIAPPVGTADVAITLSGAGVTVHGGALAFTGVDPAMPVRASVTGSGEGTDASVSVTSAPDDLVVSIVGHGNAIVATGTGQSPVYIQNVTTSTSLDNSAASTASGAPTVAMTWTFIDVDVWQMIVSSLRPR
jgi:hypothetical protein